ncbi:MAG TPA: PA2779 family protein [Ideonella sp.]|nr:PA2779 family protein [Ideonella sp.]
MTLRPRRLLTALVAACVSYTGFVQGANAALIGTEQVATSQGLPAEGAARAHVLATLERADVVQGLEARGVDPQQVRARVDALSDTEVAQLAQKIDSAPAGASDILGVIVTLFVVLLITDILGFTKVFPFTRSIR